MATIQSVRVPASIGVPKQDGSYGYPISTAQVKTIEVVIALPFEEAQKMAAAQQRGKTLPAAFGVSKAKVYRTSGGKSGVTILTIGYDLKSNPHNTQVPHEIAERTLQMLQSAINALK